MGIYCTAAQALDGCKSSTNVPALIISGRVSTGFNWLGCLDMSFLMMSLWFKEVTTSTLNEDKWSINLQVSRTNHQHPPSVNPHTVFISSSGDVTSHTGQKPACTALVSWKRETLSFKLAVVITLRDSDDITLLAGSKGFRTMDVTNMKTYQYLCRVLLLHACANVYI